VLKIKKCVALRSKTITKQRSAVANYDFFQLLARADFQFN